ncbi:sensor histidine kinase [Allorhizobium taibaishanense]|uniref:histidine kinase n=1 Tax=Allorhizobium taibaishanense TaxID=887144 RepID=A0A1Q9A1G3_9HYPH|nr:ATP-binding protein [Allorhizobium taibaishanense]MBB4007995.1 C4-dicarboxylate-specific signal transduction histidine kinase [Allorhizobium taibaishanense]OLP48307.1 hypothetical protein BJF91_09270 [Allorhizobium taibaishanense]
MTEGAMHDERAHWRQTIRPIIGRGGIAAQSCLVGAILLGLTIFLIDAFTSLASAIAVLYVLVIMLCGELGSRRAVIFSSAVCAALTVMAFICMHGFNAGYQEVLRLVFSLAANGVTSVLLLRRVQDLALQRVSEEALRASEHRYRTIFETLAVAIWEHDFRAVKADLDILRARGVRNLRRYLADHPDFVSKARRKVRITDVNQTALRLLSVASKAEFFLHLDDLLAENDESFAECLVALYEGQSSFQAETKVRDRRGRLISVIVALNFPANGRDLQRVHGSVIDITERLEFQDALDRSRQELDHAARAAMIGEISASIAHEVNQPLSSAMTFAQAALRWLDRNEPDLQEAKRALQETVLSTEHAANVVKRVQMLLGKAKSDSGEVVIETAIRDALRQKQTELAAHAVQLALRFSAPERIVQGDLILLQQAFLNIIGNAVQAMDGVPVGQRLLTISTSVTQDMVKIILADTGPGLGDKHQDTLFKAFVTTKPGGMGLGLAMCRSIVTAHGGTISIKNAENGNDETGAVVEISLPSIRSAADRT